MKKNSQNSLAMCLYKSGVWCTPEKGTAETEEKTMLRFEMCITDRKELVKRLGELTGEKPQYTGVPKCAYETSEFTVLKDGTLECHEDASEEVVNTLLTEGFVKAEETTMEEETAQETANSDTETTVPESDGVTVSVPMDNHGANSLRNLINLVYTRASLLNKALGTAFRVDEDVIEALKELPENSKVADVMYCIGEDEAEGFQIEEDRITFGPLPDATPERIRAFTELIGKMNNQAMTQNRIQAKAVNDESEKYALRIWLIRLGMNGPEFKETRKVLMQNLSGSAAFRNDDEKAKWTARQAEKRAAARAEVAA